MRILQANVIYGSGSTGRIVETLHHEYQALGHESFVLYGRGPKQDDPNVIRTGYLWEAKLWRAINMFTGNVYSGSPLSTIRLKRTIKKLRPDVVHIHCINGNMCDIVSLLKWLKKERYKTVVTHHAKFLFTGGCGINTCQKFQTGCGGCPFKKEEFGPFAPDITKRVYRRFKVCFSDSFPSSHTFVSPWLRNQALVSGWFNPEKCAVVCNPVSFPTSCWTLEGVPTPYVLFPTSMRASLVKGTQWLKPLADALKSTGIKCVVTDAGVNDGNLIFVGHRPVEEMRALYSGALATVLLSSVESFGLPVVESLLCGTPVIGFKAGGPDSLLLPGSTFVDYGDIESIVSELEKISLLRNTIQSEELSRRFSPIEIAKRYESIYIECIGKNL